MNIVRAFWCGALFGGGCVLAVISAAWLIWAILPERIFK